jgi:flavoprotein
MLPPPPDAITVASATFNTINKWAAGISDTVVLGLLTEALFCWSVITLFAWPLVACNSSVPTGRTVDGCGGRSS